MDDILTILQYVFLGILQGLTEPLPISSSGHLVLFQHVLRMESFGLFFEIILHIASLMAIVVLFHKRIGALTRGCARYIFKRDVKHKGDFHYVLLILLAAVPIGIAGLLLAQWLEGWLSVWSVGVSLFVTGAFLLLVQRASVLNTKEEIGVLDALTIGVAQIAALLPGISRSGSTFVGGLLRKISFEKTIEFSFLLYIPVTLAVTGYELFVAERTLEMALSTVVFSFVASAVATVFAFRFFVGMVKRGRLKYFAYYCFAAGTFALIAHFLL